MEAYTQATLYSRSTEINQVQIKTHQRMQPGRGMYDKRINRKTGNKTPSKATGKL